MKRPSLTKRRLLLLEDAISIAAECVVTTRPERAKINEALDLVRRMKKWRTSTSKTTVPPPATPVACPADAQT